MKTLETLVVSREEWTLIANKDKQVASYVASLIFLFRKEDVQRNHIHSVWCCVLCIDTTLVGLIYLLFILLKYDSYQAYFTQVQCLQLVTQMIGKDFSQVDCRM